MSYYQSGDPQNNSSKNNNNNNNDWVSWVIIIVLFASGAWFFALPMLFTKLFAPDGKKRSTSIPPLRQTARDAAARASAAASGAQSSRAQQAAKDVFRSPSVKKSNMKWLKIVGIVVAALGVFAAIGPISNMLAGFTGWYYIQQLLQALAVAAAGAGMYLGGMSMSRSMKRYAKYQAVMGTAEAMSISSISRKLGYGEKRVAKDLSKMIDKGYFGETAYLNMELGYFFRSGEADAELTAARSAAAKKAADLRRADEADSYEKILMNIRAANDRIADPVLSEKIDRLEAITARIFKAVQDDPSKLGRISTFLNYYLPTTQKLLDSYAEFDSTGIESGNLREAKARIESTMDSIVAGFEHQLDDLYKDDTLDVDSDLQVMRTMLDRNTSSVEKDFGLKPGAPAPRDVDLGGSAAQEK